MKAFTDYPFQELGDTPSEPTPIREVEVLDYDGNKMCQVFVEGQVLKTKIGYLYQAALWKVPIKVPDKACILVFCHVCGRQAAKINPKGQGLCPLHIYHPYTNAQHVCEKQPKVGRNDPCPCGQFGLKFKNCCGKPVPNKLPKPIVAQPTGKKLGEEQDDA